MKKPCKRCNGTGREPVQKIIGRAMKALRIDSDVSQTQLARLMGIDKTLLSRLEAGTRNWNTALIQKHTKSLKII